MDNPKDKDETTESHPNLSNGLKLYTDHYFINHVNWFFDHSCDEELEDAFRQDMQHRFEEYYLVIIYMKAKKTSKPDIKHKIDRTRLQLWI